MSSSFGWICLAVHFLPSSSASACRQHVDSCQSPGLPRHAHRHPRLPPFPAARRGRARRCLRGSLPTARRRQGVSGPPDRHGRGATEQQRRAADGRRRDRLDVPGPHRHAARRGQSAARRHGGRRRPAALAATPGPQRPPLRFGLHGRLRPGVGRAAGRQAGGDALELHRPPGRGPSRRLRRARRDLREGRQSLHLRRRDRRHGPGARDGRGRPRARTRAARGPAAGDVPEAARRPEPVQRSPRRAAARSRTTCSPTCARTCPSRPSRHARA